MNFRRTKFITKTPRRIVKDKVENRLQTGEIHETARRFVKNTDIEVANSSDSTLLWTSNPIRRTHVQHLNP